MLKYNVNLDGKCVNVNKMENANIEKTFTCQYLVFITVSNKSPSKFERYKSLDETVLHSRY